MANDKIQIDLILNDKDFKKGVSEAVKDTQKLGKEGGISTKTLSTGFKAVAGAIAAMGLYELGKDMQNLAAQSQGVSSAFKNSFNNAPQTLKSMQEATGGTVSNLSLMQKALNAKNLKIPVETLNAGLKLARQRAAETGESVEFLAQSVVLGLGRESVLILDNLGISAKRLAEETARTGNFMSAAANIINTELKNAPPTITTLADSIGQVNAETENMKEQLALELTPAFQMLQKEALTFLNILKDAFNLDAEFKFQKALADNQQAFHDAAKGYASDMKMLFGGDARTEIEGTIESLNKKIEENESTLRNSNGANTDLLKTINGLYKQVNQYTLALEYLDAVQEDLSKGAIEEMNDKIATQKELINAAAEKDLPVLNRQLALMEARLNGLKSLGTIEPIEGLGIRTATAQETTGASSIAGGLFPEPPIQPMQDYFEVVQRTRGELEALGFLAADVFGAISDSMIDAVVNGENMQEAFQNTLQAILVDLMKLIVKLIILNTLFPGAGGIAAGIGGALFGIGSNATGTPNFGGGLTMVGEYGAELVSLPGGASISSASRTSSLMGGGELNGRLYGTDILISTKRVESNRKR